MLRRRVTDLVSAVRLDDTTVRLRLHARRRVKTDGAEIAIRFPVCLLSKNDEGLEINGTLPTTRSMDTALEIAVENCFCADLYIETVPTDVAAISVLDVCRSIVTVPTELMEMFTRRALSTSRTTPDEDATSRLFAAPSR